MISELKINAVAPIPLLKKPDKNLVSANISKLQLIDESNPVTVRPAKAIFQTLVRPCLSAIAPKQGPAKKVPSIIREWARSGL